MKQTPFRTDFNPAYGTSETVAPGLARVVAQNPSPMTFTGTNSYILGEDSVAVIDPGPDDLRHLDALLGAIKDRPVSHIFVTHAHLDHSPLSRAISAETGAPVLALGDARAGRTQLMEDLLKVSDLGGGEGVDAPFSPDQTLADGQVTQGDGWALRAIATPGHFSNHMCFEWVGQGALFSGDHVMGWASTLVSPPDGDLTAFMTSLEKLAAMEGHHRFWPGHGASVDDPGAMIAHLLAHRRSREAQIKQALTTGPRTPWELTTAIYTDVDQRLLAAAMRNVFAHLIDLVERDIAAPQGPLSPQAVFALR